MTLNKYLQLIKTIAIKLKLENRDPYFYPLCKDIDFPIYCIESPSDFLTVLRSLFLIKKHKNSLHLNNYVYAKHYDLGPLVLICNPRSYGRYFYYLITKEEWENRIPK